MYRLIVKSPEGEEIELVATHDKTICEGAKLGAEALFNLFADDMELDDNYLFAIVSSDTRHSKYQDPDFVQS